MNEPVIPHSGDWFDACRALLDRVDALQGLLATYRIQSRPSGALWRRLELTEQEERGIRTAIELRVGTGAARVGTPTPEEPK